MRDACAFDVSVAKHHLKQRGGWLFPDLVIFANPTRRDSGEVSKRVHAVEIECAGGFGIQSIYQAHEQGRGADHTWVFGLLDSHRHSPEHRARLKRAAREQGVGLVYMTSVTSPATWETVVPAPRLRPTRPARTEFLGTFSLTAPTGGDDSIVRAANSTNVFSGAAAG